MSHTEAATSMSQEEAWKLIKKQAKEIADLRKWLEEAEAWRRPTFLNRCSSPYHYFPAGHDTCWCGAAALAAGEEE